MIADKKWWMMLTCGCASHTAQSSPELRYLIKSAQQITAHQVSKEKLLQYIYLQKSSINTPEDIPAEAVPSSWHDIYSTQHLKHLQETLWCPPEPTHRLLESVSVSLPCVRWGWWCLSRSLRTGNSPERSAQRGQSTQWWQSSWGAQTTC